MRPSYARTPKPFLWTFWLYRLADRWRPSQVLLNDEMSLLLIAREPDGFITSMSLSRFRSVLDDIVPRTLPGWYWSIMPVVISLAILVARGWRRLDAPEFWGEDGRVFTAQALRLGWHSLLMPMHGSFFTLQRLAVLLPLEHLPLSFLPDAIVVVCFTATAGVFAQIVSHDYEWIIPDRFSRLCTAVLFCLAPGLTEMLGNLCNTNWILFCWVSLQGLRDPAERPTVAGLLLLAACVVSLGTAVLLVPLFLWRVWWVARFGPRGNIVMEAIQLVIILVLGVGLILIAGGREPATLTDVTASVLAMTWSSHLVQLAVVTPWLGDQLTYSLYSQSSPLSYAAAATILGSSLLLGAWRVRDQPWLVFLVLWGIGASLWTVLVIPFRPNALNILRYIHDPVLYESRYSFIVSFVGVLWWCAILSRVSVHADLSKAALTLFCVVAVATSMHRFTVPAYGEVQKWRRAVPALERSLRTGCPKVVVVGQYPDKWAFGYSSPKPNATCP